MNYYVKFTGKFKELIPDGWAFQKLYARNYRQYSKTSNGKRYGPTFRVWQHLGGYIEYQDYFNDTWLIFNWVTSGEYTLYKSVYGGTNYYTAAIDAELGIIEVFDPMKHDSLYIDKLYPNFDKLPEEERRKILKDIHDRYRKVVINDNEVDFILDLKEKGWFEIVEDKRK
jgi:hypothetical protein